jgi:protein TonB
VFVQFVVDQQGQVQDAQVVRSTHPLLDNAALRVIRQSQFRPGQEDGSPVKVRMSLAVTSRLPEGCPQQK